MIDRYRQLNTYFKTVFWSIVITLAISVSLIPLFFFNYMDIPLGILLGGLFGSLYYLLAGFNQKPSYDKKAMHLDVFYLILRFVLFAAATVGLALLYYLANIHIFNVYGFVGAYLISLLIFMILGGKEKAV